MHPMLILSRALPEGSGGPGVVVGKPAKSGVGFAPKTTFPPARCPFRRKAYMIEAGFLKSHCAPP